MGQEIRVLLREYENPAQRPEPWVHWHVSERKIGPTQHASCSTRRSEVLKCAGAWLFGVSADWEGCPKGERFGRPAPPTFGGEA